MLDFMHAWLVPIVFWGGIAWVLGSSIFGRGRTNGRGRTITKEPAVIVRKGRVTKVTVALDEPKVLAVNALMRDGWKRTAAVSALANSNWVGYPDPNAMVLAAWHSMPSYR
jgi:hypothetical protein